MTPALNAATARLRARRPTPQQTLAYLGELEDALQRLPPELFDYRYAGEVRAPGVLSTCGCVVFHLDRRWKGLGDLSASGIQDREADYLMGYGVVAGDDDDDDYDGYTSAEDIHRIAPIDPTAQHFSRMPEALAAGVAGIAEAVRRVGVVRQRVQTRWEDGRG